MVAQVDIKTDVKKIPRVKGVPFVGSTLEMAKDPAAFFVRAYRDYGPVYQVNVFGRKQYVIAGVESACRLYTSPSPRDLSTSRMPSSA